MEACTQTEKPQQAQDATILPPTEEEVKSGSEKKPVQNENEWKKVPIKKNIPRPEKATDKAVLVIGNSQLHDVNPRGLSKTSNIRKETAYTIAEAEEIVCKEADSEKPEKPDVILFHLITNDVKTHDETTVSESLLKLTKKTQDLFPHRGYSYLWAFLDLTALYRT